MSRSVGGYESFWLPPGEHPGSEPPPVPEIDVGEPDDDEPDTDVEEIEILREFD